MDIEYLERDTDLQRFLATLATPELLAVDTEAASFHRYHDRVYLLQLSSRTRTAVIDPLGAADLAGLGRLLADPAVEIVFHDADYDLRMLDRDYGFRVTHIFDTRIAAQLLNEPAFGLAALLEKYFGVTLNKKFQRADWSRRPLAPGMLEYAATDTHYLPGLRDLLRQKLAERHRLEWALEEFRLLEDLRWNPGTGGEPFWKLKGARTLRGSGIAVLRELYEWRDQTARQLDRAPFRVMNNETLVELATALPRDREALGKVRGISPDTVQRRGAALLAAIERGLAVPASEIPRQERPRQPRPDQEYLDRLERLKQMRNQAAAELDLAPGVLCPNGTLEGVARVNPRSLADLDQVPELRRWQREVLGPRLVRAAAAT